MQQIPAKAGSIGPWIPFLLGLLTLCLTSCRKEEITTFSTPKDSGAGAPPPKAAVATPQAAPGALKWSTPSGWKEQPPGGMRVGSFTVSKDEKQADVSIIPLGGISGGTLDNVNRWRGQVGLPPVDGAKLGEIGEKTSIGSTPATLYDMAGKDPKTGQPTRILATSLSVDGTTWFFKMLGPDDLVESEKPHFKEFLQSVRFEGGSTAAQPPQPPPLLSGGKDMANLVAPAGSAAEKPVWDVPTGWKEQAPTSMRLATYAVNGEQGGKADVSVIKLAGGAGGLLANVNRWRSQVGLDPVDETGLPKLISSEDVNGAKITFVDMAGRNVESGESARLLAAVVPREGVTWFYKMLGTDALVAQQKPAFIKFVQSARYPNA
jgi:hypothetical protein